MKITDPWPTCQDDNVSMARTDAISLMRRLRNALRCWSPTIAVAVLTAHRHRRRTLRRQVELAARQLENALPLPTSIQVSVIVQQCLGSERPLAGCYLIGQRSDGSCRVLFRLAMAVDDRCLDIDTILAALAEEWIGFATQQADGPSVSVPIDLLTASQTVNGREADPRPNGWEFQSGSANLTGRAA
jgi:hypothetical protein